MRLYKGWSWNSNSSISYVFCFCVCFVYFYKYDLSSAPSNFAFFAFHLRRSIMFGIGCIANNVITALCNMNWFKATWHGRDMCMLNRTVFVYCITLAGISDCTQLITYSYVHMIFVGRLTCCSIMMTGLWHLTWIEQGPDELEGVFSVFVVSLRYWTNYALNLQWKEQGRWGLRGHIRFVDEGQQEVEIELSC